MIVIIACLLILVLLGFVVARTLERKDRNIPSASDGFYQPEKRGANGDSKSTSEGIELKSFVDLSIEKEDVEGEIYLDIETLRISTEVQGGWASIDQFGVAVAITWDIQNHYRVWLEPEVADLITELKRFQRIVTYNGDRFDLFVLSGYGSTRGLATRSFDVLTHVSRALGHRVKLDSLALDTIGIGKSGDGLDAVRWWREGDRMRVIEYCQKDVELLIRLVAYVREHGHLKFGRKKISVDWNPRTAMLTPKEKSSLRKATAAGSDN